VDDEVGTRGELVSISPQGVTLFGYISITLMLVMLGLLVFQVVPTSLTLPFFLVALALYAVRLVLRIRLARRERDAESASRQI
jgi:hypothetical protein